MNLLKQWLPLFILAVGILAAILISIAMAIPISSRPESAAVSSVAEGFSFGTPLPYGTYPASDHEISSYGSGVLYLNALVWANVDGTGFRLFATDPDTFRFLCDAGEYSYVVAQHESVVIHYLPNSTHCN